MKVLFLVHGFPPELAGGTEQHVHELATAIARGDASRDRERHDVVVCAGTLHGGPGAEERWEDRDDLRVLRLPRTDLYYDHWQKSSSPAITARVRELIRAERPDVVAVHHWLRLSRDLVLAAAREGVPAAVHLHDHWTTCPIAFRVRPKDGERCESPANGMVCPPCAGCLPPFTPWVAPEEHFIALAERQADLARELSLARVVSAPSRAHAESVARFLDGAFDVDAVRLIAPRPARAADEPPARPAAGPPWTFAHWGGLSRLKGTDLLFEAVSQLAEPTAVRLELAGVEERPGFLDDLRARFPDVAFAFHGPFEGREGVPARLRAAHAAVFPTRALESYGIVVDEALHAGLPCALADVPAFRERLRDGDGVQFVESASAAALAALLQTWIDDPATLEHLAARVPDATAALDAAHPTDPASAYLALLHDAIALGPPDPASLPPEDWYSDRIKQHALEEWDRRLSECGAAALGLADV